MLIYTYLVKIYKITEEETPNLVKKKKNGMRSQGINAFQR